VECVYTRALYAYHADTAPASCTSVYITNSIGEVDPFTNIASVTAGFTWDPDTLPRSHISRARVRPMIKALPVEKMAMSSKNVPKNSAMSARTFMIILHLFDNFLERICAVLDRALRINAARDVHCLQFLH
jgi:hypothetical protein